MELPVVYIFTHDSIGVGEDGPTHQPVEQLAGLRAIPGLVTLRPDDGNEVVEAGGGSCPSIISRWSWCPHARLYQLLTARRTPQPPVWVLARAASPWWTIYEATNDGRRSG
jgi:hypothetical protein